MKAFFNKPYRWAVVYTFVLIGCFSYALLDAFLIPKALTEVSSSIETTWSDPLQEEQAEDQARTTATITESSYEDDTLKIEIETVNKYNTTFYVADVCISEATDLKAAFAQNTFGRNIKETTSQIAEAQNAIFAVNGDFYGFRESGYVLRNGVVYRESQNDSEVLVIGADGAFSIASDAEKTLESLAEEGAWQVFSFGPALLSNGELCVTEESDVAKSRTSNPRTAIGEVEPLHYIFIVADGRTEVSEGLSLLELAREFQIRGCKTAYNLDGGGSSTMYFNGSVVNVPTDGKSEGERKVSDIVYLGG